MEFIEIGQIVSSHGIKGEVKVKPLTDFADNFKNLRVVYLGSNKESKKILSLRVAMNFAYLMLENVVDRNTSDKLRGINLFAEKKQIAEKVIGKNNYYINDIIGCSVITENGDVLGRVTDLDQFGSADIITIDTGKGENLFPFIDTVVLKVDIVNKQITVNKYRFKEVCTNEN
ncbi:MAG: ribosome maturation factor RimM [Clostridia bacterium]|jgi:16S rRNA processing protein RimM|nr:ribosome maturation factor RimM [Clostridia bacterium]MDD4275793.1 ribosome maturation factor RimM [Clostridia bacterium]